MYRVPINYLYNEFYNRFAKQNTSVRDFQTNIQLATCGEVYSAVMVVTAKEIMIASKSIADYTSPGLTKEITRVIKCKKVSVNLAKRKYMYSHDAERLGT